ncbi:hypothetical protein [Actinoplanes xinjiangensis]|uniref:hypothetical protein n=1 Tax=Actinoplanes xinjiangensis TaxID=512350 RepID=UPI0011B674C1|nr:hypothetical protein [Actinoplanes xinjiangensis]GIF44406.1 hypothetical protein Axi01nite_87170 [Actinoplanes xinjiangensis]
MLLLAPEPSTAPSLAPATVQAVNNANLALLIAVLGVIGSLIVAIVNHFATRNRERERWALEEKREAIRWERERQERREQWEREDAARWNHERRDSYSNLLGLLANYIHILEGGLPAELEDGARYDADPEISKEVLAELDKLKSAARNVSIWAPMNMMSDVWEALAQCAAASIDFDKLESSPVSNNAAGTELKGHITVMEANFDALKTSIRRNLGVT